MKYLPALLDFLRNLTPQVLLLSVGLVLGVQLNLHHFEFTVQGFKNAFPYVTVMALFIASFFANILVFFEKMLNTSDNFEIEVQREAQKQPGFKRFLWQLVVLTWRHEKMLVVRAIAIVLFASGGFVVVFSAGIPAAISAVKAINAN